MGCCIGDCCIFDCCVFDFCSDHGCSYHPSYDNKTVEHTVDTSNELAEMKERANREGKQIGEEAFQNINTEMERFLEILRNINQDEYYGKRLNIDLDTINQDINAMKNSVKGFIGDKINERLVMTDGELAAILEDRDDDRRTRKFNEFYRQLHQSAVRELIDYIQNTIAKEFETVDDQIRTRLNEVDKGMQEALQSYNEAVKAKEAEDAKFAEQQANAMYRITLADIMLDELSRS